MYQQARVQGGKSRVSWRDRLPATRAK